MLVSIVYMNFVCSCFYVVMCLLNFFFSSRRRHTRCALVTGVQTVCSSDLAAFAHFLVAGIKDQIWERLVEAALGKGRQAAIELLVDRRDQIGRASCRERVCQYV